MAKKIKRQQGNLGAVQKLTVQVQKSITKIAYCFLKMVDKSKNSRLTSPRRVVYNKFEVPIRCAASEIFFIMSLRGKPRQRWGFASDGTILGEYCGDVIMPLRAKDVEGFMVTVVYQDGSRDTALPLNLFAGQHGVSGDVGVLPYRQPYRYGSLAGR